jgi:hypothetical protein
MIINVSDTLIAGEEFVKDQIKAQIAEMGYEFYYSYIGLVKEIEPIKVDDIKKGMLWWKATYHRWYWKIVSDIRLEPISVGKYKITICVPQSQPIWKDQNRFIEGLKKRLSRVNLEDSIDVVFVAVTDFPVMKTDDLPSVYGYGY